MRYFNWRTRKYIYIVSLIHPKARYIYIRGEMDEARVWATTTTTTILLPQLGCLPRKLVRRRARVYIYILAHSRHLLIGDIMILKDGTTSRIERAYSSLVSGGMKIRCAHRHTFLFFFSFAIRGGATGEYKEFNYLVYISRNIYM